MHGFNRHPSLRKVNISINLQELQDMVEGDNVNLGELGYDKLLGKGKMNRGMNITVAKASARAVSKVEAAGGTVTIED
jgi:large subunit ribosomal protein L15